MKVEAYRGQEKKRVGREERAWGGVSIESVVYQSPIFMTEFIDKID